MSVPVKDTEKCRKTTVNPYVHLWEDNQMSTVGPDSDEKPDSFQRFKVHSLTGEQVNIYNCFYHLTWFKSTSNCLEHFSILILIIVAYSFNYIGTNSAHLRNRNYFSKRKTLNFFWFSPECLTTSYS